MCLQTHPGGNYVKPPACSPLEDSFLLSVLYDGAEEGAVGFLVALGGVTCSLCLVRWTVNCFWPPIRGDFNFLLLPAVTILGDSENDHIEV